MIDMDPDAWWLAFQVNLRGTYNVVHYALPHIVAKRGAIVLISSIGAQFVREGSSSYQSTLTLPSHTRSLIFEQRASMSLIDSANLSTWSMP
jgi:NAD(P)-dependent dehydrogenase (short-subunit alcohol dehydrogenase family)